MTIANQIVSFKLSGINYNGTSTQLNYTASVNPGIALASKSLVLDSNKSVTGINTITANNIITNNINGILQSSDQPNITKVGQLSNLAVTNNLNIINHNNIDLGLSLAGVLVTASAVDINTLSGVTNGSALANKALVLDSNKNIININNINANSINMVSLLLNGINVNTNATQLNYLQTTPGVSEANKAIVLDNNKNNTGINVLTLTTLQAINISGSLISPIQSGITSVGTLTSLVMSGSIAGVVNIGISGNISGANVISANTFLGTLGTSLQPNITSVGTLTGLLVDGIISSTNITTSTLTIGTTIVTSSGNELNTLSGITPGNALANKSVILDSSRNITNINSLTCFSLSSTNITGLLQTENQPNITSVGILSGLNSSGVINTSILNNSNTLLPYMAWTNNISGNNIVTKIETNNSFSRIGTTTNHPFRLFSNNVISMSLETNGNISIGTTLSSIYKLNVNGSINTTSLNINGNPLNATAVELNKLSGITDGIAMSSKCLVTNNNNSISGIISLSASILIGTVLTGAISSPNQPNITSLGELSSLTVANGITNIKNSNSNSRSGILFSNDNKSLEIGIGGSSNNSIPNGFYLYDNNDLSYKLVVGNNGNISIGSLTTSTYKLNINGSVNANSLFINGIQINASSNELNTLSGVSGGVASANKSIVLDNNKSISGINILTATNISGLLTTQAQSNITSVGTLSGLSLSGAISGVTNLSMSGNLTGASILSATTLSGTLSTANQSNITNIGILSNLSVTNNIKLGLTSNPANDLLHMEFNTSDQMGIQLENRNTTSDSGSYVTFNGYHSTNNNYDLASIKCGYVAASSLFGYGYLAFSTRNSSGSTLASERMRITQNGNIGVGTTNPTCLLDVNGTFNALNITGMILTSSQPNITSLGTLTNLSVSGAISASSCNFSSYRLNSTTIDLSLISGISPGSASPSKALILDSSKNITGINALFTTSAVQCGQLQIGGYGTVIASSGAVVCPSVNTNTYSINGAIVIDSSRNLTSITSIDTPVYKQNGTTVNFSTISGITAGTASISKALVLDSNRDINNINNLTSFNLFSTYLITTYVTGSLIKSTGIMYSEVAATSSSNYTGYFAQGGDASRWGIGCDTQFNTVKIGSCNSGGGWIDTCDLRVKKLYCDSRIGVGTTNPDYPLHINSMVGAPSGYAYTAYTYNGQSTGILATPSNVSIYTSGRIICNGELDVISDRRFKENIKEIDMNSVDRFINEITPKRFNYIKEKQRFNFGYIAQDLVIGGFSELSSVADDETAEETIDENGFVSPKGIHFGVITGNIIPLLHIKVKQLSDENILLKKQLLDIINRIELIEKK